MSTNTPPGDVVEIEIPVIGVLRYLPSMEDMTNPRNHAVANPSRTNAFVAFGMRIRESLALAGKRGGCYLREKNLIAL